MAKKRIKTKKKRKRTKKNLTALEILEKLMFVGVAVRKKFLKTIHYGLRKGNKIFVTFATINNN